MKIYDDILEVREDLTVIRKNMRKTVVEAEKRLGVEAVLKAFRLLAEADQALVELYNTVRPAPPPPPEPTAEELMEAGYM